MQSPIWIQGWIPRFHPALAGSLLIAALLLLASPALARSEALRWSEAKTSSVAGFRVYWGNASGQYSQSTDVGKPSPDASGNYTFTLTVPDPDTVYVAVTAYNASGQESVFSNQQVRTAASGGSLTSSGGGSTAPAPAALAPLGRPGRPKLVRN